MSKRGRDSGPTYTFGCAGKPDWLSNMKEVTPASVSVNHPVKVPDLNRLDKRLQSSETNYASNGNNILTFDFPNISPIDFRGGFVFLNVILSKTGGTYIRIAQGVWSIINKVRILFGDFEDEIQYYNRFYSYLFQVGTDNDVKSTIGYDLLGLGLASDRNTWGADAAGTSYVMPFYYGLFRQGILPMNALSSKGNSQLLRIELYLENPSYCIETDGTNPIITINNLRWHYTQVTSCNGDFEADLGRIVSMGAFQVGFETHALYSNPVLSSAPDIIIQWKGASLNAFVHWFVDGSTYSTTTTNDKFITFLRTFTGAVTVNNYQMNINETWLPVEAVDCTGIAFRAYLMFLNYLGLWKIDGRCKFAAPITLDGFNDDEFFMVQDCRSIPRLWSAEHSQENFNNVTTSFSTSNTLLRLSLTAPPPANLVLWTAVCYNVLAAADKYGRLYKKY